MSGAEYVVVTAGQAYVGDEDAGHASVGQSSGRASEAESTPGLASVGVDGKEAKSKKDKKRKKKASKQAKQEPEEKSGAGLASVGDADTPTPKKEKKRKKDKGEKANIAPGHASVGVASSGEWSRLDTLTTSNEWEHVPAPLPAPPGEREDGEVSSGEDKEKK